MCGGDAIFARRCDGRVFVRHGLPDLCQRNQPSGRCVASAVLNTCACAYACLRACVCVRMYMCMCMCICICVCMHVKCLRIRNKTRCERFSPVERHRLPKLCRIVCVGVRATLHELQSVHVHCSGRVHVLDGRIPVLRHIQRVLQHVIYRLCH